MLAKITTYDKSAIFDPVSELMASVVYNIEGDTNELAVSHRSHVCPDNSSTIPLGIDGVFTGDWQDTLDYNNVVIGIKADEDSALDGLQILWSADGSTVHDSDVFSILADAGKVFTFGAARRYVKLIYTNGGTAQTTFALETRLIRTYFKPSSHRINDAIVGEDDAELMKSVLTGLAPDGTFKNVLVTNAGEQKVSIESFDGSVATTLTDSTDNMDGEDALNTASAMFARVNDTVVSPVQMDASTHSLQTISYEHHEIHGNSHYFIEDFTPSGTFDATDALDFVFTTDDSLKWVHLVFNFDCTALCQLDIYEDATVTANTGTLITQRANNRAKVYTGSHTAGTSATVMTDSGASFPVDGLIGWKIYNITDGSYGVVTDNDATTVTVSALVGGTDNDWDTSDRYEINRSLSILRLNQTITDMGDRLGGQSGGDATNPNRGIPGGAKREEELVLRQNTTYIFRFTSGVNGNILTYNGEFYEHTDKD